MVKVVRDITGRIICGIRECDTILTKENSEKCIDNDGKELLICDSCAIDLRSIEWEMEGEKRG